MFQAAKRLPIVAQFLLVPLPVVLGCLAYGSWRWTQADWGPVAARTHRYHLLGWALLPLTSVAAALFAMVIARGVQRRPTRLLVWALGLTVFAIVATFVDTAPRLAACACDIN